jgi:dephospho-CoA kinase
MLRVALTGGIATGKSVVVEQLRRRGVPCLDADDLAHGVTTAGTEATAAIAERFGHEVLDASGAVDRQRLGALVFADSTARGDLEALVHPAVYRAIEAGFRAFEILGGYPLAVADIPLLYETGRASDFHRVIATTCSVQTQLARLAARGLNQVQASQRLAAQWTAAEKAARAHHVIDTEGTFDDTNVQLERILQSLVRQADPGGRKS